jgi:hypothetical protein
MEGTDRIILGEFCSERKKHTSKCSFALTLKFALSLRRERKE